MGKFAIIPHAIIKDENINSFDLAVYIVLMKHINHKNRIAFPGLKTICDLTKCSKDRVIKSIVNLELQQWLRVKRVAGEVNIYELIVRKDQSMTTTTTGILERLPLVDAKDTKNTNNKNNIYNKKAEHIFDVLVDLSNRKRLRKTKNGLQPVIKALKNKYTEEDLIHIIKVKCIEWKDDINFKKYLHPSTLFSNNNIDKYLAQELREQKKDWSLVCKSCGSKSFIGSGDRRRCLKCQKKM